MRDFTLNRYKTLLETLLEKGYSFITFRGYQADKLSMLNVPHRGGQSSMIQELNERRETIDVKNDRQEARNKRNAEPLRTSTPLSVTRSG